MVRLKSNIGATGYKRFFNLTKQKLFIHYLCIAKDVLLLIFNPKNKTNDLKDLSITILSQ